MDGCDLLCLDLEAAEHVRSALDHQHATAVANRLKVFADPTRLLIAQALHHRELCGCDLGWIVGCSDKVVSHHLARLRREGLVESRRDGKVVFATLTPHGRDLVDAIAEVAA